MSATDRAGTLHRLLKLQNRLMAPFSTHLEHQHRISLNEFRLLMTIGRLGSTASHELAAETGVNAMSVSRAVTALEKHGRIEVQTDPANRRRKTITLTPEGRRLYQAMLPTTERVVEYLFAALSPEQLGEFDATLNKLTDALEAQDEQGGSLFLESTRPESR